MKTFYTLILLMIASLVHAQTAAPTQPPRLASDVISIFAGEYNNVAGTDFNPNWGQASNWPNNFSITPYGGDDALRYQNSGTYQGTRLSSNINVTDINKLHVNIFSPTITSLRLFLIKTDGGLVERSVTVPLTPGQWNTVNIDVNATTFPGLDLTLIREIKYDQFAANSVLIIDNFYFWREAGSDPSPTITGFSVPAQVFGALPFELTPPASNSPGAFSYTSSNTAVATVSGNTITVVGTGSTVITANQAAVPGEFAAGSTTATLNVTPPAAPTPPARNSFDVISFFSDSYALSSTPTWGGTTNSNIQIEGNNTRLFTGFTNGQIAFTPTNVSQMTHVRVDVYSVNLTPMWFFLGSPGATKRLTLDTPINGWTTLDIPLTDFTSSPVGGAIDLNSINVFRFENPVGATAPPRTIYIDNIYFYRPQTDAPPTLGTFTVPTKVLGDAPFTLTPPTSDSPGAWSYSISPAGIATIDGDVVTIIGGGTATITANQAAVPGEFGPGLVTASFVVTFPDPGPSPVPPAREPDRVISLFTGTPSVYANVPNYRLGRAFWTAGATLTEISNGDNTALRVDNLGFIGLIDIGEVGPPAIPGERRLNLVGTGMTHLNIDIYLDSPRPNLFVVLLAPGDRLYNTGPLNAGWNTLRIPLTAYPGPLNDIYGLKIEQNYAAPFRIFVDNFYFSNDFFTFYADADGDGFGDINSPLLAETAPSGYVENNTDCDDTDPTIWQLGDFYIDIDGDGYSFDGILYSVCYGDTIPEFYSETSLGIDCDDFDPTVWRNADFYVDADGDGYSPTPDTIATTVCYGDVLPVIPGLSPAIFSEVDCNDNDATIYPGATEICYDGILQNCDGELTDGCPAVTTTFWPSVCDSTLPSINTSIRPFTTFINQLPSGVSVTGYNFRITNLATNAVREVEKSTAMIRITETDIANFGTDYFVEVSIRLNAEWQPYGPGCIISTPALPTTTLNATSCGATLPVMQSRVFATTVTGATGYRFEVSRMSGATAVQTLNIETTGNSFRLTDVPGLVLLYATEYQVRVQVRSLVEGAEVYSSFGSVCSVFTPDAPEAAMIGCDLEVGLTPSTLTTLNYATAISDATLYRFTLTDGVYNQVLTTPTRGFRLSQFNALSPLTAGATYTVFVEVQLYGEFYAGKDCTITVPGGAKMAGPTAQTPEVVDVFDGFKALASPNPFEEGFSINVYTNSTQPVGVAIYDMTGRLLETREVGVDVLSGQLFGERYPSGVYNIVVTQDEEMKTVRVIKK